MTTYQRKKRLSVRVLIVFLVFTTQASLWIDAKYKQDPFQSVPSAHRARFKARLDEYIHFLELNKTEQIFNMFDVQTKKGFDGKDRNEIYKELNNNPSKMTMTELKVERVEPYGENRFKITCKAKITEKEQGQYITSIDNIYIFATYEESDWYFSRFFRTRVQL